MLDWENREAKRADDDYGGDVMDYEQPGWNYDGNEESSEGLN